MKIRNLFFIVQNLNASLYVNVGNNIHLKGSILASNSNNLNLTTNTLTYENIYDKDKGKKQEAINKAKENR